jgi:hypothetical protein
MPFPLPSSGLIDDYNRADENPITGYTKILGGAGDNLQIINNQLCGTSNSPALYAKNGVTFGDDQEAFCTIATVSAEVGEIIQIVLRYNGTNFYYAELGIALGPIYTIRLAHDSGAVSGLLAAPTPNPGSVFGARIRGQTFAAFLDGSVLVTRNTSLIPSGSGVGIGCEFTNWRLDDFSAGNSPVETPCVSLNFNFNIRAAN